VYKPDPQPHSEASEQAPSDIYGFSKQHSEHYVEYIAARRGLSSVIVRLFNVVGPGETTPHLVPEIVAQLKAGRNTISLGNLSPKRDYIHVQDAARGFLVTATTQDVPTGKTVTVNLGTSNAYSVTEIVDKLRTITQIDFKLEQEPGRVRKVDRPFLAADNAAIRRTFGWEPSLTIDDALADLWKEPDLASGLVEKYR
jgi:UDP-glucose 4-epimerase